MTAPAWPGLLILAGLIAAAIGCLTLAAAGITALHAAILYRHRTQAALDRVRALHRPATHGTTCVYCAPMQRIGYDTTWPCDTIRALDDTDHQEQR